MINGLGTLATHALITKAWDVEGGGKAPDRFVPYIHGDPTKVSWTICITHTMTTKKRTARAHNVHRATSNVYGDQ